MFTNVPAQKVTRAAVLLLLWYIYGFERAMLSADVIGEARRQSKPRRWPWQPKTARDYIDAYRADLAALVNEQGGALLEAVQRQSRRRRWPWQPKTIRDLLGERSAELIALAVEWSAELAEAAAERAAALRAAAQQQSRPRRWPWQPKTLRDQITERNAELATRAVERSAELALLARQRRDALLKEVRRQSRPRRWPWQPKTLHDQISERGKQVMVKHVAPTAGRLTDMANTSTKTVSQAANTMGERVQQLLSSAPNAVDSATTTTTSALKGASQNISTALNATAEAAATAVQRPVTAVNDTVQAGRRRMRRGVRLVRTALWAALLGVVVGLLFAKASGAELRQQLRAILDQAAQAIYRKTEAMISR
jgi:gas vesicle protein